MASSSHLRRDNSFQNDTNNDTDNDANDLGVSLDSTLFTVAAVDDVVGKAIADAKTHYESLREDYIREGCVETWGEFPSSRVCLQMRIAPGTPSQHGRQKELVARREGRWRLLLYGTRN